MDIDNVHRPLDPEVGSDNGEAWAADWLDPDCTPPPMPCNESSLFEGALIDENGVESGESGEPVLTLCKGCCSSLQRNKVPHTFWDIPSVSSAFGWPSSAVSCVLIANKSCMRGLTRYVTLST